MEKETCPVLAFHKGHVRYCLERPLSEKWRSVAVLVFDEKEMGNIGKIGCCGSENHCREANTCPQRNRDNPTYVRVESQTSFQGIPRERGR